MSPADAELSKIPGLDLKLHDEAASLYAMLSPAEFCRHGERLLNGPNRRDVLEACAGLRAIGNSPAIY